MTITIIGAGPGGYETALAAAAKGIDVNLISDGPVGGTCLNEGCIPTKTLCRTAEALEQICHAETLGISSFADAHVNMAAVMARKDAVVAQLRNGVESLLKGGNVRTYFGKASFKDAHTVAVSLRDGGKAELKSDKIVIATGSVPACLPVPGADLPGVVSSREMLETKEIPQRLCVIGGGVIGLELASVFKSFGSEVTVLEYCGSILPRFDSDLSKRLKQALSRRGINIVTSARVTGIYESDSGDEVKYQSRTGDAAVYADKVLMAVGRRPALGSLNLDDIGIAYTPKGIVTDTNMRTNIPDIYAVGDVCGGMMLAHVATSQGIRALSDILGEVDGIDFSIVPATVFTSPEAATVGKTEEDCVAAGIKVHCLKSFFRANGKAVSMGEPDGFCKMIVASDTAGGLEAGQILGCHVYGAHSADLVHEVAALMNMRGTVSDLKRMIHAHPTLSEVILSLVR